MWIESQIPSDVRSILNEFVRHVQDDHLHDVITFPSSQCHSSAQKGIPRLAITLEGCHEITLQQDGQQISQQSRSGQAYFFDVGMNNANTNAKARKVVTLLFMIEAIQLNIVEHGGDPAEPANLAIYRLAKPAHGTSLNLLNALRQCIQNKPLTGLVRDITRALLKAVCDDLHQVHDQFLGKAQSSWANVLAHLQENIHLPLSRNMIASNVSMSPNHLSTLCRQQTGQTFNQVVNQFKMERAENLLHHSSLTISEISTQCGYEDPSYFSRLFKKLKGITPLQYRHQQLDPQVS